MIKCKDIAAYIEKLAPLNLACDWDNPGLLVGDGEKEIKKVLICLDNDEGVTAEAIELGADMIISHHPIMFSPINHVTEADPEQRMIRRLCEKGICHYAAHTNMDCAIGGLNDYLAKKLGLENATVLEETSPGAGFGRVADMDREASLSDFLEICADKLNLDSLRYVGDPKKKIGKVAVNSGSGADILPLCISKGVDLLITGDLKYTPARDAMANNVAVIDAGHYGTEIIFAELMTDYLSKEFPCIEFVVSKANTPVINTYTKQLTFV